MFAARCTAALSRSEVSRLLRSSMASGGAAAAGGRAAAAAAALQRGQAPVWCVWQTSQRPPALALSLRQERALGRARGRATAGWEQVVPGGAGRVLWGRAATTRRRSQLWRTFKREGET